MDVLVYLLKLKMLGTSIKGNRASCNVLDCRSRVVQIMFKRRRMANVMMVYGGPLIVHPGSGRPTLESDMRELIDRITSN